VTYTAHQRRRQVEAAYRYRYELAKLRGIPTSPVPAQPAANHINTLHQLGWSYDALAALTGNTITGQALRLIAIGNQNTVQRATNDTIHNIPHTLAPTPAVPDAAKVPALGAARRVHALLRLGWTHTHMRNTYGMDTTHIADNSYRSTIARKWRAIDTMYRDLCMTPGPSSITTVEARNRGYAPPLAWHDIDDPDDRPEKSHKLRGTPHGVVDPVVVNRLLAGERLPSTQAEKLEAMRRWVASGRSQRELARLHGWNDGRYSPRHSEDVA
jgi:hypothetical protein